MILYRYKKLKSMTYYQPHVDTPGTDVRNLTKYMLSTSEDYFYNH